MKTLTLISSGLGKPPREELLNLERSDLSPRRTYYDDAMNSVMLDEYYLANLAKARTTVYSRIPTRFAQVVEAYLVRKEYDAVISWAEGLGLLYAGLMKYTGVRSPHIGIFYWISSQKKAQLFKRVQSHFDRVFFMSHFQRDFAVSKIGIAPERAVVLPFHVDQKFWRPMPGEGDLITTSGREWRDYSTLIQALKETNIRCHIAAKVIPGKRDAWIDELEQAGPLPPHITVGMDESITDVRRWYARSRFVVVPVYPSDAAVGTTVILEAMAMGKAVICSKIDGHRDEAIQDGITGLFVPPKDPRALKEAVEHLWNNPALADQMGRAGRKRVEQHHTLERWVGVIKKSVEELMISRRMKSHYQLTTDVE